MKKVKLSEGLSLSAVVQGFWRLDGWNWSAKELARGTIEKADDDTLTLAADEGTFTFNTKIAQKVSKDGIKSAVGGRAPETIKKILDAVMDEYMEETNA